MKKLLNNRIFIFILSGIIFTSITIAAYTYTARDIIYIPENSNWNVHSVQEAIDDLKNKQLTLTQFDSLKNSVTLNVKVGSYIFVNSLWDVSATNCDTLKIVYGNMSGETTTVMYLFKANSTSVTLTVDRSNYTLGYMVLEES